MILRFAETLPDDVYGIHIDGSVTNIQGQPFNGGVDLDVPFTLDQGTKVISVVPQPIVRDPNTGALSQAKIRWSLISTATNSIPLRPANPAFYQLTDEIERPVVDPDQVLDSAASNQAPLVFRW